MTPIIVTQQTLVVIENRLHNVPRDGSMQVEFKRVQSKRSLKQNALYWQWLTVIAADTGYTKDELHTALRKKFLGSNRIEAMGEVFDELPSTTKLKVAEFTEYLEEIENLANDIGITLPKPEDLYFEAVYGAKRA